MSTTQSYRLSAYLPLSRPAAWQRIDWIVFVGLFAGALAVYTATLAPGLSSTSFDTPELITKSAQLRLAHMPGAPIYVWMGHLFSYLPFGEVAERVNWMSAFFAAVAVALLFAVVRRHIAGERLIAVGSAALFGLSLTLWSQAVVAELYAPNIAFLTFVVLALLEWGAARRSSSESVGVGKGRWWLVAAVGVFGLSLGIHPSNTLYLPAFGLFALLGWPVQRDANASQAVPLLRRFDMVGGALCLLGGVIAVVVPYLWVYSQLPLVPPGDGFPRAEAGWPLFYESTFNAFRENRFGYTWQELPDRVVLFLHLLLRNLGPVGVGLMLVGVWRLLFARTRIFFLLVPMMAANLAFYVNYRVPDNDVYYIPAYMVASCLVAGGLEGVVSAVRSLLSRFSIEERAATVGRPAAGETLGLNAGPGSAAQVAVALPALVAAGMLLAGTGWQWSSNYAANDLSDDVAMRDFWANAFTVLPERAFIYHRGGSPGYDLLYYTELCGVRPDLRVQAGTVLNEPPPARSVWPEGPVYSGATRFDCCLPNFLEDPDGSNPKWFEPLLAGMSGRQGVMQFGWLNLYRVRRVSDVPPGWMVPIEDPASVPSQKLEDAYYTSGLELVGVDAEPRAQPGKPWRMVRYWYSHGQSTWIPPVVTILGDYLAIESHIPLYNQLDSYINARGITDLGLYVIKEEMNLVIPSNTPPGTYEVTTARAEPRLMTLMVDPAGRKDTISMERVVTTIEVVADPGSPPPDPLDKATNERCRR